MSANSPTFTVAALHLMQWFHSREISARTFLVLSFERPFFLQSKSSRSTSSVLTLLG
ncbi:MAG: hypothetical protein WDO74_17850 [Pseudomonadota bacterium]